ncbi:hypothetical protein ACTA71_011331 [Dictyostelium dimigraforme]
MKIINIILFVFIFIILNGENVKSVSICNVLPSIVKAGSCGDFKAKLQVMESYFSFQSVGISPFVSPIYGENGFDYYLKDGVQYTITFQRMNCGNQLVDSFTPNGMYYEIKTQPLCSQTFFDMEIHNYYINGSSKVISEFPGSYSITNEAGSCPINFLVTPQSSTKGVLQNGSVKMNRPTCGFNNGSIVIDLTKGYSNVRLYFSNDSLLQYEIQPNSPGSYLNLYYQSYTLYATSQECGNEVVEINLYNAFTPLNVELVNVPNLFEPSTFTFSLSSGESGKLNSSNTFIFTSDNDNNFISNWTDYQDYFKGQFEYGFYYSDQFNGNQNDKSCETSGYFNGDVVASVLNYTLTRNGDSCLNGILFTVYPLFSNPIALLDITLDGVYQLDANNQAVIPYNRDLGIQEKMSGPTQYFSTVYMIPTYSVVETTKGGASGCWSTYNITINKYETLGNLTLKFGDTDTYFIPVNGVFINIPSGDYQISYIAGDCETKSFFTISLSSEECPQDQVSIQYKVLENATCSTPYEIEFTASTPFGLITDTFNVNSFFFYDESYNIEETNAFFQIVYFVPSYPVWDDKDFNVTIDYQASCTFTKGTITLSIPNDPNNSDPQYEIVDVMANGVSLQSAGPGTSYFIPPGENNVTIQYRYGGYNDNICYKSKSVVIDALQSLSPDYSVIGVSNCSTPDGIISVVNYQDFSTISLTLSNQTVLDASTDGKFTDLYPGSYQVYFEAQSCNGFVDIIVPTSEDNVEIVTSVIQNPTCVTTANYADGLIKVDVKKDGVQLNGLSVSNLDDLYSDNNVYFGAKVGSNSIKIQYGQCIWYRNVNVAKMDDPMLSFDVIFNQTSSWSNLYKLNVGNPNVTIKQFGQHSSDFITYQGDYYLFSGRDDEFSYSLMWNTFCYIYDSVPLQPYTYKAPPVQYKIVKADSCYSLKIDVIITNMNDYLYVSIFDRRPISINSTHAIFKGLPPSVNYPVKYLYSKENFEDYEYIGAEEMFNGFTKETLNIVKKSNDICHSGIGSFEIQSTLDTANYYYSIQKSNALMNGLDSNAQINGNQFTNLPAGYYIIARLCKSVLTCFIREVVVIENESPSIESVTVQSSYGTLNNGTVEIKLNYVTSNPVTYEIIGTQLSNTNGKFTSLSPKSYQVKVTITDRMCPTTLTANFDIILIPAPTPSPTPSSTPSSTPSDELSTSNFLQANHLLLIVLILVIIF